MECVVCDAFAAGAAVRGSGCRSGNRRLQVHRRTRRGHSNALALERLCTASAAALHRQSKSLRVVINLEISRLTTLQASRIVKMGVGSDSPAAAAAAAVTLSLFHALGCKRSLAAALLCFPASRVSDASLSLSLSSCLSVSAVTSAAAAAHSYTGVRVTETGTPGHSVA